MLVVKAADDSIDHRVIDKKVLTESFSGFHRVDRFAR